MRYCPTTEMWSDILNKPKQGTPFKKDRAMLMNVPIGYDDNWEFRNTHPALLPQDENLGAIKAKKPIAPSRSVLGELGNKSPPGILTNGGSNDKDKYRVSWAGVVSGCTVP